MDNAIDARLGRLLLEEGLITDSALSAACEEHDRTGRPVADCLTASGAVSDEDAAKALGRLLDIPYVSLRSTVLSDELVSLVPVEVLRKHSAVPIGIDREEGTVILAMADPLDMAAQDDVALITGCRTEPAVASVRAVNALLDRYFGSDEILLAAEQYEKRIESRVSDAGRRRGAGAFRDVESEPIVQLVNSVIEQAVRKRASDIHIDPRDGQIIIRFRIDGVLTRAMTYDSGLLPAIVTRIKIMGGMDISEKRRAQDGRITKIVDKLEYDIRVSTLPTTFGEKIVLRLASSLSFTRPKSELGLRKDELERFDRLLSCPDGMILVTGPTGSGKSTTMYTALSEINSESVNIITVEDPVEASIPGINQVQVNPKAGLTFASALRSILRQDPDVIMIGEIRDRETASIAVQASITGHLVVSTLHTSGSAATVTRLLDMGIESFLLADAIVGVIAQRLVRVLCPCCKRPRRATFQEKRLLGRDPDEELTVYDAVGCEMCSGTGYYGRTGVYEIMEITPSLRRLITERASTVDIKNRAVREGMSTLRMSAAEYVVEGSTTLSEMLKVSFDNNETLNTYRE